MIDTRTDTHPRDEDELCCLFVNLCNILVPVFEEKYLFNKWSKIERGIKFCKSRILNRCVSVELRIPKLIGISNSRKDGSLA